jgi:MoxR-like ATPase
VTTDTGTAGTPDAGAGDVDRTRAAIVAVRDEVAKAVVGHDAVVTGLLAALITRGHVLLEGVPGTAKTLLVKALAASLRLDQQRVQFTPDLMPSDVLGQLIYLQEQGDFRFRPGPVFTNLLLADEINRTPPKTQAALLEAMEERQVSTEGENRRLPEPFAVVATQNPVEYEGTYPLPEAQIDRFMMKIIVDYPEYSEELTVVERSLSAPPQLKQVLSVADLSRFQQATRDVYVDPLVSEYAVILTMATRHPDRYRLKEIEPYISFGASPRGSINLVHAARALALLRGRRYALPQDVQEIARDVLRHRIVLSYQALAEEITADRILTNVLAAIVPPRIDLAREPGA